MSLDEQRYTIPDNTSRTGAPKVFVSYAHDSEQHKVRVSKLATRLREHKIQAICDQDISSEPPNGWPAWCAEQVNESDYIVAICTPTYKRRFEQHEEPGSGRGVVWEGRMLYDELYEQSLNNRRIVPVLVDSTSTRGTVPWPLDRTRKFHIETDLAELSKLLSDRERLSSARSGAPQPMPTDINRILWAERQPFPKRLAPSHLLNFRYEAVPFDEQHRRAELRILHDWCSQGGGVSVRVFVGPGGAGKTRLLSEWCQRLRRASWNAGFLPTTPSLSELMSVLREARPTFIAVDYAEKASLEPLFDEIVALQEHGRGSPLRVALLARHDGEWLKEFAAKKASFTALVLQEPPIELRAVPSDTSTREKIFLNALQAFAQLRGLVIESSNTPRLDLSAPVFGTILHLHAQALHCVEQAVAPAFASLKSASILESILDHEERFWVTLWPEVLEEARPQALAVTRRFMAAITLLGGVSTRPSARNLYQRCGAEQLLRQATLVHESILDRISESYGDQQRFSGGLEPDLLGAELITRALRRDDSFPVEQVFVDASANTIESALIRMEDLREEDLASECLRRVIAADLVCRVPVAYRAATKYANKRLSATLLKKVKKIVELEGSPFFSNLMLATATDPEVVACRPARLTAFSELDKTLSPETDLRGQAMVATEKSAACFQAGDLTTAIVSGRKALSIYRNLLRGDSDLPEQNRLSVVSALSHLGGLLSQAGNHSDGLAHLEEAREILDGIDCSEPSHDVIRARRNVMTNLASLYMRYPYDRPKFTQRAADAGDEAVKLGRMLLDGDEPDQGALADSLFTLANTQTERRQWAAAIKSLQEAIRIYDCLAEASPGIYTERSGRACLRLSLVHVGRRDYRAALDAVRSSEAKYRRLAPLEEIEFDLDLAMVLHNKNNIYQELGQLTEAVEASREAVRLHLKFVEKQNACHEDFLTVLRGYALRLVEKGLPTGNQDPLMKAGLDALNSLDRSQRFAHQVIIPRGMLARPLVFLGIALLILSLTLTVYTCG